MTTFVRWLPLIMVTLFYTGIWVAGDSKVDVHALCVCLGTGIGLWALWALRSSSLV